MLMYSLGSSEETSTHLTERESGIFIQDSESIKSAIHYHIRWSDSSLDWKPFLTEDEAAILAGRIKKRNETFTIVE